MRAWNAATTRFSSSKNASAMAFGDIERETIPPVLMASIGTGRSRSSSSIVRGWCMPMKECPTIERPAIRANRRASPSTPRAV